MILALFIVIPLFAKEGEAEALQFLQEVRHDEYNRVLAQWRKLMPLRYRLLESTRRAQKLAPRRLEEIPEATRPDKKPHKTQPIPPKKPPKIP